MFACQGLSFLREENGHHRSVIAFILWLTLGWRAGAAEILAEIAIGLLLYSGGGGKRIRRTLRDLSKHMIPRRVPAPA
jgi:hypothetical protein